MDVTVSFDELSSMLVQYHILCTPTELTRKFNRNILDKYFIADKEKELYNKIVLTPFFYERGGTEPFHLKKAIPVGLQNHEDFNLDYLLDDLTACENDKEEFRSNLQNFHSKFKTDFESMKKKMQPYMEERMSSTQTILGYVYGVAEEISGIKIPHPDSLAIRLISGLYPISMGSNVVKGKGTYFEDPDTFISGNYFSLLIHETIAHQTSSCTYDIHKELFGEYLYDADEGFACKMTDEVGKALIKNFRTYDKRHSGDKEPKMDAYHIFGQNWDKLEVSENKTNFHEWYRGCLRDFKKIHPVRNN